MLPIGITFIGGAWDEPELIGLAYDFEQATQVRVPPTFIPTIGDDPLGGSAARQPATKKDQKKNGAHPATALEDAAAAIGGDHRRHDEARPFGRASCCCPPAR